MGKRPTTLVGDLPEGCSPNKKPYRQFQVNQRTPGRTYGKSRGGQQNRDPVKALTTVKWDKMPPLEEEEMIAKLDAAIDEAGDEEEEKPKPLDEADITEAGHRIKDDPMLHLALGLTKPYWASMALAVGVWKLYEYQAHKNHRK